jgi:outer membrane protein assembly factor BamB
MATDLQTKLQPPGRGNALRAWSAAAWVSGIFCLLLALGMVFGHLGTRAEDPLKSPQLKQLKEKLRENPLDDALKQQIRNLDHQVRGTYFRQLSRMDFGVYLLIAGAALFVFAVSKAVELKKLPPMPVPKADPSQLAPLHAMRSRLAVAGAGVAVAGLLFLITLGSSSPLPGNAKAIEKLIAGDTASAGPDAASAEELKVNWPCFRGFNGAGLSTSTNAPAQWDPKTGAGVLWKVPSPTAGFNSPLVWNNRVYFSGGDEKMREVICLDGKTGQLLWRKGVTNVAGMPAKLPEIPESTGYAAPTMATDGRRVYAIFATGETAAFTMDGKPVWAKFFGPLQNPYGHAISLATWKDRLILQLDQGESEEGKSKLCAIDGRTGQTVWQKQRKVGSSWASPIVIEAAGKTQIITLALPHVIAYSATDAAELWRVEVLNGEVTPSPVFAAGFVLVASPSEKLVAIRPEGQGDVTKSHIAWENEDYIPDVSSPGSDGELVFMVTTSGMLTCLDVKDGKKVWEHDFEMECHASPTVAGNHLYIVGQKGVVVVVEAVRQFKELFRVDMGDAFHATPAIAQDRLYLRGVTNVWCLGK